MRALRCVGRSSKCKEVYIGRGGLVVALAAGFVIQVLLLLLYLCCRCCYIHRQLSYIHQTATTHNLFSALLAVKNPYTGTPSHPISSHLIPSRPVLLPPLLCSAACTSGIYIPDLGPAIQTISPALERERRVCLLASYSSSHHRASKRAGGGTMAERKEWQNRVGVLWLWGLCEM